jgi:hypothetical protein
MESLNSVKDALDVFALGEKNKWLMYARSSGREEQRNI